MSLNIPRGLPVRRLVQVVALAVFAWLFFHVAWPHATVFSATVLADKEHLPAESLLWLDALVGPSTALAARAWNPAVWGALAVAALCVVFPRAFCGHVCPLGTLTDAFDWLVGRLLRRRRSTKRSPWVRLRFYLLAVVLAAAALGVVLAGYVAPIPVLTRGLYFTGGRLQLGLVKGWSQVPHAGPAVYASVALFGLVFLLGLLGSRFWCRHVCPSGALLAAFSPLRLAERRVGEACTRCGRCAEACAFGAVAEDFSTRQADCTFCQTCGGVCPVGAIEFDWRRRGRGTIAAPAGGPAVSRRGLLCAGAGDCSPGRSRGSDRPTGRRRSLSLRVLARTLKWPGAVVVFPGKADGR